LFTALLSGLADQQIANDPGGDRWLRLVDSAVDMYLGHVGASAVIASAKNATTPTGNRRRP
jgi:hypothetical protein